MKTAMANGEPMPVEELVNLYRNLATVVEAIAQQRRREGAIGCCGLPLARRPADAGHRASRNSPVKCFIVFALRLDKHFQRVSTGAEMHMMLVASGLSVHRQFVSGAAITSRTIALARIGSRKKMPALNAGIAHCEGRLFGAA
ncbi:MAG: hypothetical protein WBA37_18380 [Xanthobacteraceae bacterium]